MAVAISFLVAAAAVPAGAGGLGVHVVLISPPSDAARPVVADLLGVSCVGASACLAVGTYQRPGEVTQPMVVANAGARWVSPRAIALPPSADPTGYAALSSLSCKTMTQCVAVGTFTPPGRGARSGSQLPMVAIAAGGRWLRAIAITLPSDAATGTAATGFLSSVTCIGAVDCVAVGTYLSRTGHERGFRLAVSVRPPMGAVSRAVALPFSPLVGALGAGSEDVSIYGVSCWAPSNCVAVGVASTDDGTRSIAVTEETRAATWLAPNAAPLPPTANPVAPDTWLSSVTCPAAGRCLAVGSTELQGATSTSGLVVTRSPTGWTWSAPVTAAAGASVLLDAVSCAHGGAACAATGDVVTHNGMSLTDSSTSVVVLGSLGGLAALYHVALPVPSGGTPDSEVLESVDCTHLGACTAVGSDALVGSHVIVYAHPASATFSI